MKSAIVNAPLLSLASATSLYRIEVAGDALAPRYKDGDLALIQPAIDARPETIEPGSVVLVALEMKRIPGAFQKTGMFLMNGDGDLVAGDVILPRDSYAVLGIAIE